MRAAAIQLEARLGDVDGNLAMCERLAAEAAAAGADLIVLPEFFSSAIGFDHSVAAAVRPVDGEPAEFLRVLARRHRALVGGSFLARDADGEVRNAFLLFEPDGSLAGRHDKDLPTMWENSFYVGGLDDGVIEAAGLRIGVALCWELMRTQTARRLRGRVDLVVGGSGWWSIPENWRPRAVFERSERRNRAGARRAATDFAAYVGAPVVHAAHAGRLSCAMPAAPGGYEGRFEGATLITDSVGRVLAERSPESGQGVVVADVEARSVPAQRTIPNRFWLHKRGLVAACAWNAQRWHGRRYYARRGGR